MKRKLLAALVTGLVASGAFAQMNVNVTGVIDLTISHYTGIDNAIAANRGSQTVMNQGQGWGGSNVRISGTEDLGGGLKASFAVETGFNADGGAGQAAPSVGTAGSQFAYQGLVGNREASMALVGGFGSVKFGRMGNAGPNQLAWLYDPFGDVGASGVTGTFFGGNYKDRVNNAIQYDSPSMSGFKVTYQFAMSENQDKVAPTVSGSQSTLSVTYNNGPLSLMGSQTALRDQGTGTVATLGRMLTLSGIAGSYDLDVAKLMGQFWNEKTTEPNGVAATADLRHSMLGVSVPVGAHSVLVSYRHKNDRRVLDQDSRSWSIGYNHTLSKRTSGYLRYSTLSNTNVTAAATNFGGGSTQAFQTGMWHTF